MLRCVSVFAELFAKLILETETWLLSPLCIYHSSKIAVDGLKDVYE